MRASERNIFRNIYVTARQTARQGDREADRQGDRQEIATRPEDSIYIFDMGKYQRISLLSSSA